ncbi:hypothetical protein [Couchioplanes caeruleus]|uniref:TfoX N-terminal domain-containing protein n=2 Tax=Couchioplanes caeruleus TaxID=56438 RepID=A0A1K0FFW3_9ACTN|nr:hypothetical protein [Couchioplanes caeruleus]OJF11701.1 hypothetical protein BG844_24815 [Couchioplanes caeruleus subsp. caeruleus]ROP32999.1 hypothetical protein EDD30_5960 [Couchioplanes caeruleus]
MSPEDRFNTLVDELAALPGVAPPGGGGFGSRALRIHKKIFAMLVDGRLVLKLPKARVDTLVAAAGGTRLEGNKGTPMKEWLVLDPACDLAWAPLAREAVAFVGRGRTTDIAE